MAWRIESWIKDLMDRLMDGGWVCRHRWCLRQCTYQYRCHKHQDDP